MAPLAPALIGTNRLGAVIRSCERRAIVSRRSIKISANIVSSVPVIAKRYCSVLLIIMADCGFGLARKCAPSGHGAPAARTAHHAVDKETMHERIAERKIEIIANGLDRTGRRKTGYTGFADRDVANARSIWCRCSDPPSADRAAFGKKTPSLGSLLPVRV